MSSSSVVVRGVATEIDGGVVNISGTPSKSSTAIPRFRGAFVALARLDNQLLPFCCLDVSLLMSTIGGVANISTRPSKSCTGLARAFTPLVARARLDIQVL